MSYQELHRLMIGAMMIASLLVGCGTPASLPTLVPPSATQTAMPPTRTFTSLLPTATPTAFLPTTTPAPESPTANPIEDSTLATSADEIIGTWHEGSDYIRFDEDGTFRQAHGLEELDDQPYAICSYQFEGTVVTITEISVSGVPSCKSKTGTYEIRMLEDGDIQIVTLKDQCRPRAGDISGKKKPAVSPAP